MLELAFATRELRSACEDAAEAEKAFGPEVARTIVGRLADLRAAGHPLELPFAKAYAADGTDPEHVVVTLAAGGKLVIAANHAKPPRAADGSLVWERVSRVIILRVE